ncbi:FAD-dependent oxidoreductase [Gracilibacillus alcaliphilus]|uniref:FAD-dependent oxidoreductase n=1 Tax=Gracilibacillus alcaliphilus TaxID=1401441 RepID=UPI00195A05E3|nr:FAD-dependent oxidoreductase [Gracilibacillus alcaliphilus]MBM7676805.1 hypothetical protein [Gracilibacillus alcaliphilus]
MENNQLHYYQSKRSAHDQANQVKADMCIYGGTSAGVAAAVKAKHLGFHVVMVECGNHVGGMTTSGLGMTDIGNKSAVGGLSRTFYEAVGRHYGLKDNKAHWRFEPHVAEKIYQEWLEELEIPVYFQTYLAKVEMEDRTIKRMIMENGDVFTASIFFDATYEGDLLAKAGVSYHVGRESNRTYKETLNGIHFGHPNHNFTNWIDPYVIEGKPDSGLLYGVTDSDIGYQGQGDHRIQAYNFRICLTNNPNNQMPFYQPESYNPDHFLLLLRYITSGVWDVMRLSSKLPNDKTDFNNYGAVSTDHIGFNYNWPEGDYLTREEIFQDHVNYNLGMLYFLSNDERVPQAIRKEVSKWGLPLDEFERTKGWPHQLYIREGRRMKSDYVMTEHECRGNKVVEDSIGLAAYTIDSHNCRRLVVDGRCINEGNVEIPPASPFPISYQSIVPKAEECNNLLVPVCLSSSHIAYGSIRMEPVFMILGESAATAASIALEQDCDVQEVDYAVLRKKLLAAKQILEWN